MRYLPLLSFLLFAACNNPKIEVVKTKNRQILVNNSPYIIKGFCYHPVPKGSNTCSYDNITQDLQIMNEAGVNTLRIYSPVDDVQILDDIYNAGIKIIVGFGYNQDGYYDILSGSYINYIEKYKKHPAILFWELGNEYNYHPEWFEGDIKNWYAALNIAASVIHRYDTIHPVATAHGELPDSLALAMCPDIDIWGMNVYRWDNPEAVFTEWAQISSKPMYLSEAGADSYMAASSHGYEMGINEKAQANAIANILAVVSKHLELCSGLTLYSFVDELWKAGNPYKQDIGGWAPNSFGVPYDGAPNEEFWGVVDIDRNKKIAFDSLKVYFNKIP